MHQLQAEGERSFQANEAEGRGLELQVLFEGGMRGVVAGDGVQRAVFETRLDGGLVRGGAETR